MKKITFLIYIVLFTINLNADDIAKWLEIEIKSGAYFIEELGEDYDGDDDGLRIPSVLYDSDEYLKVIFSYQKKKLKEQGFRFLSHEKFREKIKEIYNIDIDKYKQKVLTCSLGGVTNSEFQGVLLTEFDIDFLGLFFIHKDGFVTESYRLPEIIDYKNLYPKLCKYTKKRKEKNIMPWGCDAYDEDKNLRTLYVNQYLFNNDRSHLQQILKNRRNWLFIKNHITINNSTYKSLYSFCKSTGIKESEVRKLNPWINKDATNISADAEIVVPIEKEGSR